MSTAGFFSLRGLKISDFLEMSLLEQLTYHATMEIERERHFEEVKEIIKAIAKIMGAKVIS